MKVRKPVKISHWFGDESTESSSDSDENTADWLEVDRRKKVKEKKKKQAEKKRKRQHETALKASKMIGIGPLGEETIKHFATKTGDLEKARTQAAREFLNFHLAFNKEELDNMDIRETKFKKDTIYLALGNMDLLKEIYIRKAESHNDDIFLRNYIPPSFYEIYMAVSNICSERRTQDKTLKTQMRFGPKDIEILVKTKGGKEGFKEV